MSGKEPKDKVTYMDFKTISHKRERKQSLDTPLHTNPLIDKLFKFVHTKLSDQKDKYKSYSDFNPDDLI